MREQKDRYEIFLKVCETGSFSKAAEALNYTQSGISQMMAGLEEELGVQLFARINPAELRAVHPLQPGRDPDR